MEMDWSALHKILSDTTRRSILELLSERAELNYSEIMTVLQITNTGRLNYHLKALGDLISKDREGRYQLTQKGRLATNLLKTFPERTPISRSFLRTIVSILLILIGAPMVAGVLGFAAFLFAVSAGVTLFLILTLSAFFVAGLVLIVLGLSTYRNRILHSL
jgi:DNA-binding transcriptional ArsR family regulator